MTITLKIVDRALREDFGFKHMLWVYSGRRGIHCWVCDSRARKLSQDERKALVGYLEVIKGGKDLSKKVNIGNVLHPSLSYVIATIARTTLHTATHLLTPCTPLAVQNQSWKATSQNSFSKTKTVSQLPSDGPKSSPSSPTRPSAKPSTTDGRKTLISRVKTDGRI